MRKCGFFKCWGARFSCFVRLCALASKEWKANFLFVGGGTAEELSGGSWCTGFVTSLSFYHVTDNYTTTEWQNRGRTVRPIARSFSSPLIFLRWLSVKHKILAEAGVPRVYGSSSLRGRNYFSRIVHGSTTRWQLYAMPLDGSETQVILTAMWIRVR